jgi:hypothetical protein
MMFYNHINSYLVFGIDLPQQETERYIRNEEGYSTAYRISYLSDTGLFLDKWSSSYWLFSI